MAFEKLIAGFAPRHAMPSASIQSAGQIFFNLQMLERLGVTKSNTSVTLMFDKNTNMLGFIFHPELKEDAHTLNPRNTKAGAAGAGFSCLVALRNNKIICPQKLYLKETIVDDTKIWVAKVQTYEIKGH